MTPGRVFALCLWLGLGQALPAAAEQCVASGVHFWTSVDQGSWDCDESGDDQFVLDSADDLVAIAGDVVLSTGSLRCSAGTLAIVPGARLYWTGPDDDTQELLIEDDCTFYMLSEELWEGRLESVAWGGGATPEETRLGLPALPPGVQPGQYVHFSWGDLEPIGQPIVAGTEIQTEPGQPGVGQLHPSYNVGQFWRISAAGSGFVDAFHSTEQDLDLLDGVRDGTPAFNPPGISGPATSSYVGTRALVTGVQPSAMEVGKHGMFTRLVVPAATGAADADFGSRYVTWETGQCAQQRWKVVGFENDNAGSDVVIVAGNAAECGLSSFALTSGAGPGDLVRIVDRATVDGNDIAHVRVRGGTLHWHDARFVRLDKIFSIDETPSIFAKCGLCIYQESETSQIKSGSELENLEVAYMDDDFENVFVVALISVRDPGETGSLFVRRFDSLLDMCGVSARGWWIHDEHTKSETGDATHGLTSTAGCLTLEGVRVERMGDDALYVFTSHFGAAQPPQIDIRLPLLYENMGEGNSTQECLTIQTEAFGTGDQNSIVDTNVDIQDLVAVGCDNVGWISNGLGHRYDRVVFGAISQEEVGGFGAHLALAYAGIGPNASSGCASAGVPSACCTGFGVGSCSFPVRAVERFPNRISNMILFPFVGDGVTEISQRFNGRLTDSVVTVSNAANHILINLYGAARSFISLRGSFTALQRNFGVIYPANPGNEDVTRSNTLEYGPDLVAINEFSGAADYLCGTDYDPIDLQTLRIERFWYLGNDAGPVGWLESCAATSGLEVEANGWILPSRSDGAGSGNGLSQPQLTANGANVTNSCVETQPWVLPDGPNGFGPDRNGSAVHVNALEPDSDDDLPLRTYSTLYGGPGCGAGPRHLGLRELGVAHVLGLGDGGIRQIDSFSTLDLPHVGVPALGGVGRSLLALGLAVLARRRSRAATAREARRRCSSDPAARR